MNTPTALEALPQYLIKRAQETPRRIALRYKRYGLWKPVTWAQYLERVRWVMLGLTQLGLERGDRVAIISKNRPELLYFDLAVQAAGGIVLELFPSCLEGEIEHALNLTQAKIVLIEDQEQLDKVIEAQPKCPSLRRAVIVETRGTSGYRFDWLVALDQVFDRGQKDGDPSRFDRSVASLKGSDPSTICLTSGTTSKPRGVLLSHEGWVAQADSLTARVPVTKDDEYLSYIPLAWIGERIMSVLYNLTRGMVVNFPEDVEMSIVMANMREVMPSLIFAAPRVWENLCSMAQIKIENATPFKRWAYRKLMAAASNLTELRRTNQPIPFFLKIAYFFAYWTLIYPLRHRLGLAYCTKAITGGGSLTPEVFYFFQALGIKLLNAYGQTESGGIVACMRPDDLVPNTCGPALPGYEVRISESREVLIRGRSVFIEYWNDPEATKKAKRDGWVYTGDHGFIDQTGNLVVLDRSKDILELPGGQIMSPTMVENSLKFSPYIREAVLVAHGYPFVTALIEIDLDNTGQWAQRRGLVYTTFKDLTTKRDVRDLIAKEIERINLRQPEAGKIRDFALFDRQLDPDKGEVTRTSKLRRSEIIEKFKPMVDQMYQRPETAN